MLKAIGLWKESEEKTSLLFKCKFYGTALLLLYFVILPQTSYLFFVYSDIDIVMEVLATADLTIIIALVKHLTLWCKRKELQPLITYMKEDWKAVKNKIHLANMRQIGEKCRFLTTGLMALTQFMVFIFAIMNIYMLSNGYFPTRRLFYLSCFPYNTLITPIYELTCLFQYFSAALAALTYTNVDSFIAILLLHICGQLNILQYELQHLTDPVINGNKNAINLIRKNLSLVTRRHEHLIRCVEIIENCFNMMFLMQMVCLSLQICFQGYSLYNVRPMSYRSKKFNLIQSKINAFTNRSRTPFIKLIFSGLFILSVVSLFYLYCYVGDQLTSQSLELGNAAFKCNWFYLLPTEVKSLLFIILRANNPICITAGKFCTFTMITFSQVIKRSFGYLSVLLTMKRE